MKVLISFLIFVLSICSHAGEFRELLMKSVERHQDFVLEKKNLDVAKGNRLTGYSRFLPNISVSSGRIRNIQDDEETEYQRNSLDANLNVFNFGSDSFKLKSANQSVSLQKNRINLKRLELEKRVTDVIFNYLENKANIQVYKQIVKIREESLKLAKRRYKQGQLSQQDMQRVQIDLNNAQGDLVDFRIALERSRSLLVQFTTKEDLSFTWPWNEADYKKVVRNKIDDSRHPLNIFSSNNLKVAENMKTSSLLSMFGGLDVSLSKGYNEYDDGGIQDERVSLVFTIPLFEGFQDYYDYKRKTSDYYYAKALQEFNKRKVSAERKVGEGNLKMAFETYKARLKTEKISEKLFQNSQLRFSRGLITVNELFLEQDRLLRTRLLSNAGTRNFQQKVVTFCHSIGKSILLDCL